jgi:hypothetical protein
MPITLDPVFSSSPLRQTLREKLSSSQYANSRWASYLVNHGNGAELKQMAKVLGVSSFVDRTGHDVTPTASNGFATVHDAPQQRGRRLVSSLTTT